MGNAITTDAMIDAASVMIFFITFLLFVWLIDLFDLFYLDVMLSPLISHNCHTLFLAPGDGVEGSFLVPGDGVRGSFF